MAAGSDTRVAVVNELAGDAIAIHLGKSDVQIVEAPVTARAISTLPVEDIQLRSESTHEDV
jgi:hypothetical protein